MAAVPSISRSVLEVGTYAYMSDNADQRFEMGPDGTGSLSQPVPAASDGSESIYLIRAKSGAGVSFANNNLH